MRIVRYPSFFILIIVIFSVTTPVYSADELDFLDDDFYMDEYVEESCPDVLEQYNRAIFTFNSEAYEHVLKPVATGYSKIMPQDARGAVSNFFRNIGEPVRFVNCLLQGRFEESAWVFSRFFINTVCGVFGFGDPATREFHVPPIEATFGETLGEWGIGDGSYFVVPILGPSTMRDFSGDLIGFSVLSPYTLIDDYWVVASIQSVEMINNVSLNLDKIEDVKKLSFDPYVALRDYYFQNRKTLRQHDEFEVNFHFEH
ncbi:MAG: VacJ family lipoprotein [Desulfobulbus propionicus]|nr:MAG: VacJ family lipoprotein [Desulfobulbus propionicus]